MLWTIAGTSHRLLGSLHIMPDGSALPDWATTSTNGMERFVFEADHRSPLLADVGVDLNGAHLEWPGAAEVYERAESLLASIGSTEPFDAMRPWKAAFYILGRLLPHLGMSHDQGLDNRLRVKADAQGIQTEFLESATRAFDLLETSCEPVMGGLPYLEHVVSHAISDSGLVELRRIVQAWRASDLTDLAAIYHEKISQFPFIFDPLIRQRNSEWVPSASRLIADRTPTLFIVGALHTVGPGSFVERLVLAGQRVTPIATNET